VPAQIVLLLALTSGLFDLVPLEKMEEAEQSVLATAASLSAEMSRRFETSTKVSDEDRKTIIEMTKKALAPFQPKPDPKGTK
jgi:F-type H+-transporting ATPase subunit alpha